MRNKPARLHKCNSAEVLEQELRISVKELLFIIFLVGIFFLFCFIAVPQTFGFL